MRHVNNHLEYIGDDELSAINLSDLIWQLIERSLCYRRYSTERGELPRVQRKLFACQIKSR
jgi:hypothetical protein